MLVSLKFMQYLCSQRSNIRFNLQNLKTVIHTRECKPSARADANCSNLLFKFQEYSLILKNKNNSMSRLFRASRKIQNT